MRPREHIIYGAGLSITAWALAPREIYLQAFAIFFASFLIDIDHYLVYVWRKKNFNLKEASNYFCRMDDKLQQLIASGNQAKAPFFFLHSIEFLLLVGILAFINILFLYVLFGLIFHNLLDIMYLRTKYPKFNPRDFSLIQYLINKNDKKIDYF